MLWGKRIVRCSNLFCNIYEVIPTGLDLEAELERKRENDPNAELELDGEYVLTSSLITTSMPLINIFQQ